jgi:bacterioferritin
VKDQNTPSIDKQGVLAGAAAELLHIGEEPHRPAHPARSHSEYVEGDDLVTMIREDLVAERIAIDELLTLIEELEEK